MPLQIGDLLEHQSLRWMVTQRHPGVRTVVLRQLDGTSLEVPDDQALQVIGNLPSQWPFVAAPRHQAYGPIIALSVVRQGKKYALKPMQAWVPSDPLHNGGVLYLHPKLNFRPGEVLVAQHRNGTLSKVSITKSFGTVQRRLAIEEARRDPPTPQTRYDHLLMDEDDG
jgi:hypothetical protein